jgi:hypothetical protein
MSDDGQTIKKGDESNTPGTSSISNEATASVTDAIMTRRSVRMFTPEVVST